MPAAAAPIKRVDGIVHRDVAGEVFLVPIRGHLAELNDLFVLNDVGAWVWERLDGERSAEDLVVEMVSEFDVTEEQATTDIDGFVVQLREAGLVDATAPDQG
jgi:hypothetical protein